MSDQVSPPAKMSWANRLLRFGHQWGGFLSIATLLAVLFFGGARVLDGRSAIPSYEAWEHGWPFTFHRRIARGPASHRFQFTRGEPSFQPQKLLIDVAIFAIVLVAIGWGRQLLTKRSPAPRQAANFSLATLLVMMTLVCGVLGHLAWTMASTRADRAAGQKLTAAGHYLSYSYHGPVWLTRVFGTNQIPLPLEGVDHLMLKERTTDEDLRRQGKELQQLKQLHTLVSFNTNISDDGLDYLAQQGTTAYLENLLLIQTVGVTPKCLDVVGQMKHLKYFCAEHGMSIRDGDCVLLKNRGVECSVVE